MIFSICITLILGIVLTIISCLQYGDAKQNGDTVRELLACICLAISIGSLIVVVANVVSLIACSTLINGLLGD